MNIIRRNVLLIEGSDYESFPPGGQLTMARALIKLFSSRLALVGVTGGNEPVGRWTAKYLFGEIVPFFAVGSRKHSAQKPVVPARLSLFSMLRRYQNEILSIGCTAAFIQAPEAMLAVSRWPWKHLCYWFAGVESPLRVSRYPMAKPFATIFDRWLFSSLHRASLILAAADDNAVNALVRRSKGALERRRINFLPTCVDTSIYHPLSKRACRVALSIPPQSTVLVNAGRIASFKGWDLLLDSFVALKKKLPDAHLIFAGDGEDRPNLESRITAKGLNDCVAITGFQSSERLATVLNAADIAVFGSFVEGWSASMLEATACGKPLVSTNVSGAATLIKKGENGFIVDSRNADQFATAIHNALALPDSERISLDIASAYDMNHMASRLATLWEPFGAEQQIASAVSL